MESIEVPFQTSIGRINGNTPVFASLNITFLMDEDYIVYKSLANWMLSFIDDESFNNLTKDLVLTVLNNNKNPLLTFIFIQAFPINIPEISYDNSISDTNPILFTVEFSYQYFKVE